MILAVLFNERRQPTVRPRDLRRRRTGVQAGENN
jgi:hypothetical protein